MYRYFRFDYSSHKTREEAEFAAEDYYASGEIDECDQPDIEQRRYYKGGTFMVHYVITLSA